MNGSFKRGRLDPQFDNVKARMEHYHSRCDECSAISTARTRGYKTRADEDHWKQRAEAHDKLYVMLMHDVVTCCNTNFTKYRKLEWRKTETQLMAQARNNPESLCLIRLDDTTSFSLPHVGNRCPKSLHNLDGPEVLALCVSAFFNKLLTQHFIACPIIHRRLRAWQEFLCYFSQARDKDWGKPVSV